MRKSPCLSPRPSGLIIVFSIYLDILLGSIFAVIQSWTILHSLHSPCLLSLFHSNIALLLHEYLFSNFSKVFYHDFSCPLDRFLLISKKKSTLSNQFRNMKVLILSSLFSASSSMSAILSFYLSSFISGTIFLARYWTFSNYPEWGG